MLTGGTLLLHQGRDVASLFDLRATVVAARMAGEHRAAVNDADLVRVGEHRRHAASVRMRYRVFIQIEADIRGFAHRDRDTRIPCALGPLHPSQLSPLIRTNKLPRE